MNRTMNTPINLININKPHHHHQQVNNNHLQYPYHPLSALGTNNLPYYSGTKPKPSHPVPSRTPHSPLRTSARQKKEISNAADQSTILAISFLHTSSLLIYIFSLIQYYNSQWAQVTRSASSPRRPPPLK